MTIILELLKKGIKRWFLKTLQDLFNRGDIYKAEYSGFYSMRAEQFLQEKDKVNGEMA